MATPEEMMKSRGVDSQMNVIHAPHEMTDEQEFFNELRYRRKIYRGFLEVLQILGYRV